MTFESPVARGIFIYWIIAVISWWLPGWYRIQWGRRTEIGRTWSAHQKDLEESVGEDIERYHLHRGMVFGSARIALAVGWPIVMVMYFFHLVRKLLRLRRLKRFRARRSR